MDHPTYQNVMNYDPKQRATNRLYGRHLNPPPPTTPPPKNRVAGIPLRWIVGNAACLLVAGVLFVLFTEPNTEVQLDHSKNGSFSLLLLPVRLLAQPLWDWSCRHLYSLLGLWLAIASAMVATGKLSMWDHATMMRCRAALMLGIVPAACIVFAFAVRYCNLLACNRSECVKGLTSSASFLPPNDQWRWNRTCKAALYRAHGLAHCDPSYIIVVDSFKEEQEEEEEGNNDPGRMHSSFTEAVIRGLFFSSSSAGRNASSFASPPPPPHRNHSVLERCTRTLRAFAQDRESVLYTSQTVEGYACFACLASGLLAVGLNLALRRTHRVERQCLFWPLLLCFGWHALASAVLHVGATNSAESSLYKAVDHLFGMRQVMNTAMQWMLGGGANNNNADDQFLRDAAALLARLPDFVHRKVQEAAAGFRLVHVLGVVAGIEDPARSAALAVEIVVFFASLVVAWFAVPLVLGLRDEARRGRTMRYVSVYAAYASYSILCSVGTHALAMPWSREMNRRYEHVYGPFVFAGAYAFLCVCSMHRYRVDDCHSLLLLFTLLLVCFAASLAVCNGILKGDAHHQTNACQAFSEEAEHHFARHN